jgi:hypothetical protein
MNLPLLSKKRSYLKQSTDIVKNVTFEDIIRCLDKNEAESLLLDPFASDELKSHLTTMYGPLRDQFHINYKPQDILTRFIRSGRAVGADEIMDFEQTLSRQAGEGGGTGSNEEEVKLIEESTFEELLSMCKEEFEEKDEFKVDAVSKRNKDKNVEKVVESLKNKEK